MNLMINDRAVEIQLSGSERLWAFHIGQQIDIPLEHIQSVRLERPPTSWKELRSPGTYLPSLIKAGTYYTALGREFWYAQGDKPCLCIDISQGDYKRIVIASAEVAQWQTLIAEAMPVHA